MYKAIKTLEEMPGALSYLIEKVEGLEKTAQSLLNRQEESSSPHWMDVLDFGGFNISERLTLLKPL